MKRGVKWSLAALAAAAAGAQFFNPALTNPPVTPESDLMATNPPPAEIAALLHHACYDCHSYATQWPWYSHLAPVSWFVTGHVNDAREAMNFSEWPHDDAYKAGKRWAKISRRVEDGSMPLTSYTLLHPASRLTDEQRKQLSDWARATAEKLK
jgi:hypothetical protein